MRQDQTRHVTACHGCGGGCQRWTVGASLARQSHAPERQPSTEFPMSNVCNRVLWSGSLYFFTSEPVMTALSERQQRINVSARWPLRSSWTSTSQCSTGGWTLPAQSSSTQPAKLLAASQRALPAQPPSAQPTSQPSFSQYYSKLYQRSRHRYNQPTSRASRSIIRASGKQHLNSNRYFIVGSIVIR